MKQIEQYVDEKTLCEQLRISTSTAQNWRWKGGGPPFYKFGRSVRYKVSEVAEWIESSRRNNTSQG